MIYVDLPEPRGVTVLSSRSILAMPPHLQRLYAHDLVTRSIAENKYVRPKVCPKCSQKVESTLHAHHDDYSKPLRVRFLCPPCHRAFHGGDDAPVTLIDPTGRRSQSQLMPRLSESVAAYIIRGDYEPDDNMTVYLMGSKWS